MALFLFTKNILAGKPIDVFNGGGHQRDFTYIDDIVQGVIAAVDRWLRRIRLGTPLRRIRRRAALRIGYTTSAISGRWP